MKGTAISKEKGNVEAGSKEHPKSGSEVDWETARDQKIIWNCECDFFFQVLGFEFRA
jgi:hypothetical protein